MDLVVNHTSDEHAWFDESRSSTDSPKRDWYWWRPPREGVRRRAPGARADQLGLGVRRLRRGPTTRRPASTTCTCSAPSSPTSTGRTRRSGPAVYRDDEPLAGPGCRRLPDGRHQPDLARSPSPGVPGLPDGAVGERDPRGVRGRRHLDVRRHHAVRRQRPAGPRVPPGDAPRGLRRPAGRGCSPSARPRRRASRTAGSTPTRPAASWTWSSTFEHVDLDSGPRGKWDLVPFTLVDLKRTMARWQDGLADVGWNSLYWGNHDQPRAVSRFGDDSPSTGASAKALATVLHLHRGTPYVYQGDELGMTNAPFAATRGLPRPGVDQPLPAATGRGDDPDAGAGRAALQEPRQRPDADAVGRERARGLHDRHAVDRRSTPNHTEINAASQYDDPESVFTHHRALIALRHDDATVVHGDFTMLLPEHPQLYAFAAHPRRRPSSSSWPTCPSEPGGRRRAAGRRGWLTRRRCWTAVRRPRDRGCWSRGRRGCAGAPRNRATPAGGCPGDE